MRDRFSCEICYKRFLKETAYQDHLNSEQHKLRVSAEFEKRFVDKKQERVVEPTLDRIDYPRQ